MQKGFVDLQVNGWMGVDFMSPELSVEKIKEITKALVARGTIAYCPTLITGSVDLYERNLKLLAEAASDDEISGNILSSVGFVIND